jgi:hypothetical protein
VPEADEAMPLDVRDGAHRVRGHVAADELDAERAAVDEVIELAGLEVGLAAAAALELHAHRLDELAQVLRRAVAHARHHQRRPRRHEQARRVASQARHGRRELRGVGLEVVGAGWARERRGAPGQRSG